jgi:hypothetical protein
LIVDADAVPSLAFDARPTATVTADATVQAPRTSNPLVRNVIPPLLS